MCIYLANLLLISVIVCRFLWQTQDTEYFYIFVAFCNQKIQSELLNAKIACLLSFVLEGNKKKAIDSEDINL